MMISVKTFMHQKQTLAKISGPKIRVSDPDPYPDPHGSASGSAWIRINLSCWIRIQIRIQIADPDPDPGGQKLPKKNRKKNRISIF